MQYPGGKNANGMYQKLINFIPPHQVYIETHLGSGAVLRRKKPARLNFGIEIDHRVLLRTKQTIHLENTHLICGDALKFLSEYLFSGDEFIYCDPPYLKHTRKSKRAIYSHEYEDKQHYRLLKLLLTLPCKIMISGYYSELYSSLLKGWEHFQFPVRNRAGNIAIECLWLNYPVPKKLHDYSHIGMDFRERARIKKKVERWKNRFNAMPILEKQAILNALNEC